MKPDKTARPMEVLEQTFADLCREFVPTGNWRILKRISKRFSGLFSAALYNERII